MLRTDLARHPAAPGALRSLLIASGVCFGLSLAAASHAEPCFQVDASRDSLTGEQRKAAGVLFEDALRQQDQALEGSPCPVVWTVTHVLLGESYTVIVSDEHSSRRMKIGELDDAPSAYSQLIGNLLAGDEVGAESSAINRANVTTEQTKRPKRASAEMTWHIRLGYGIAGAPGAPGGPSFGFGFRRELDHFGIEASFLNYTLLQDSDGEPSGATGSVAQVMFLGYLDRLSNHSPYAGLGVGFGGESVPRVLDGESLDYSGTGLNGHAMLGYSFFRASTLRMFFQADALLPTYQARAHRLLSGGTMTEDERYIPVFMLSMGVGWGKTRKH